MHLRSVSDNYSLLEGENGGVTDEWAGVKECGRYGTGFAQGMV